MPSLNCAMTIEEEGGYIHGDSFWSFIESKDNEKKESVLEEEEEYDDVSSIKFTLIRMLINPFRICCIAQRTDALPHSVVFDGCRIMRRSGSMSSLSKRRL